MKKIGSYLFIILVSALVFLLGFDYKSSIEPHSYYQVYLDNELIGMIESKTELEKYINSQADDIKANIKEYTFELEAINVFNKYALLAGKNYSSNEEKAKYLIANQNSLKLSDGDIDSIKYYLNNKLYNIPDSDIVLMNEYIKQNDIYNHVDEVYTPNGIEIKKAYTYHDELVSIPEIYKRIIEKKSCTISGYKFTIKSNTEGVEDLEIYTLDTDIFKNAIEDVITIFVDETKYSAYKNKEQKEITTTGAIIENIYVDEDITFKAVNISIGEKIYTDSKDLSAYLLYGEGFTQKTVQVRPGDSIESISFNNKISVQEFLIFNPKYTSRDNLLVSGTNVVISTIAPKIQIVVETYEVVDKETDFSTVEEYDENLSQGSIIISQTGEKGLERVSQRVKSINGEIAYVDPKDKETIKASQPKIITIGTKYIPNVGSLASWGWPTNSGYTLSSYYGYRLAVFGEGNFHSGIDIAGTGYGSPVKAANNGTIVELKNLGNTSYGKYILINHNNGYYSLYGHMSGFASGLSVGSTVSRGQVIGYIGSTGWATGPHLHFEIRTCQSYSCTTNPLKYY